MSKLVLNEVHSKAIKALLESVDEDKARAITKVADGYVEGVEWTGVYEGLQTLSLADVARALYEGYEVELSKDAQINKLIADMANKLLEKEISNEEYVAYVHGMYEVAKIFNMVESNALVNLAKNYRFNSR